MSLTSSNRPSWESVGNTTCWGPSPDLLSQRPCSSGQPCATPPGKVAAPCEHRLALVLRSHSNAPSSERPHLTILSSCCPSHTLSHAVSFHSEHWHYSEPSLAVCSFVLQFIVSFLISPPLSPTRPPPPPH